MKTIDFYYCRIIQLIFSTIIFKRFDLRIFPDARLGGVHYMRIGEGFGAGRGLWLEAVTDYAVTGQVFSPELIIGDRVNVGEYVHIGCNHRIIIGNDVLMGSKIYITDHNHGVYREDFSDSPDVPPISRHLTENESVEIGNRCWIGEFVTILPGVTIGEGCIIGSHSTVTRDIPSNSIAVGSPARVVKKWDEEKKKWLRV
ncbi:DapH/DapD/GlmU-related protein [Selenomonas sp. GACV-9]|uniref:DapH/DapD/GlmU-related protein n=1 Tax=Selenomonas sp. GACV-9 TaxID=3158782 RepID=UPI001160ADFC